MLKKIGITVISVFTVLESLIVFAESQSFTGVDAKCRADYIVNCSLAVRNDLETKIHQNAKNCPVGYKENRNNINKPVSIINQSNCIVADTIAAEQTDFNNCISNAKHLLPQNCYRNINGITLDQIHASLTNDMRLMLTQFCKAYADDVSKCDDMMKSGEKM